SPRGLSDGGRLQKSQRSSAICLVDSQMRARARRLRAHLAFQEMSRLRKAKLGRRIASSPYSKRKCTLRLLGQGCPYRARLYFLNLHRCGRAARRRRCCSATLLATNKRQSKEG